jgi:hypothetical protein
VWYLLKSAPYRAGTLQRLARLRFMALVYSGHNITADLVTAGTTSLYEVLIQNCSTELVHMPPGTPICIAYVVL